MRSRLASTAVLGALLALALPGHGTAQNLGPQRRFIALGGYGSALLLDRGGDGGLKSRRTNFGGGARLAINLAPLSGPRRNLFDLATVGGFYTWYGEQDGVSARHYGGEVDVHLDVVPFGKLVDPFVSVAVGHLSTHVDGVGSDSHTTLSPGVGVRMPLANLLELRADGRDAIVLHSGVRETSHNPEFGLGLYLRF